MSPLYTYARFETIALHLLFTCMYLSHICLYRSSQDLVFIRMFLLGLKTANYIVHVAIG